ncbi:MAG: hypothetical protein V1855_00445 [bacterium]
MLRRLCWVLVFVLSSYAQASVVGISDWHQKEGNKRVIIFYDDGVQDVNQYKRIISRLPKKYFKNFFYENWNNNFSLGYHFYKNIQLIKKQKNIEFEYCNKYSFECMNFMYDTWSKVGKEKSIPKKDQVYEKMREKMINESLVTFLDQVCSFFKDVQEQLEEREDHKKLFQKMFKSFVDTISKLDGTISFLPLFALASGAAKEEKTAKVIGAHLSVFEPFALGAIMWKLYDLQGCAVLFVSNMFHTKLKQLLKAFGWLLNQGVYDKERLSSKSINFIVNQTPHG